MGHSETSRDISRVYRFLSQCMQYPDKEWMNNDFFNVLYNLLGTLGDIESGVLIKGGIDRSTDYIEDLQVEYTRLFTTSMPHAIAPPYSSFYMDNSCQGTYAGDTLSFYNQKGFEMKDDSGIPDHLIHELDFLSLLAKKEDFIGEEAFLKNLFRPWFRKFLPKVAEGAHHPFYRVVVQIIDFFTQEEDNQQQLFLDERKL